MVSKYYKQILWFGLAGVMIFAPLARGAVRIWSITPIEAVMAILVFLWLWRVNNATVHGSLLIADSNKDNNLTLEKEKRKNKRKLVKTPIDLPIWLFVGVAGFSCIFSIYKEASLFEMLRLFSVVGCFYLVVNNFGRQLSFRLSSLIVIMASGMALLGLGQYFAGLKHGWWIPDNFLAASYVNHNHFAAYLELAIPIALGMLLALFPNVAGPTRQDLYLVNYKDRIWVKLGLLVGVGLMLAGLLFSQSRGAWVSLGIALIVMNIVLIRKGILKIKSLAIFFLIILLGLVYIYAGYDQTAKRLQSVEGVQKELSYEGRKKIWQGSVEMIKDNPLHGTGIGTFVWGFPAYRPKGLEVQAHYAHNDYLHMMAETGVFSLPLMVWMIWVVVGKGFNMTYGPWFIVRGKEEKNKGREKKGNFSLMDGIVLGSAVGILSLSLHGLVDFNFHIPANMLAIAALAGIIMRKRGGCKNA